MNQERSGGEAAFAALEARYAEACATVESFAQAASRHKLWEQNHFGKRLYDLYLRLKQGPVRAVVMGQTSSGKSTLINALAGRIVTPESADACSPIPVYFMREKESGAQANDIRITYFTSSEASPLDKRYINQATLLQLHHDFGTLAKDDGTRPFVHAASDTFPRWATLIDTPGLNANGTDTDKLYALFDPPAYAADGDPDLPELVLCVSTAGGNLSENEMKNLRQLLDKGMDLSRIFIVDNQTADLVNLALDQFQSISISDINGLAESFRKLSNSDGSGMDIKDGSSFFDISCRDAFGGRSAMSDDDAKAHIVSLNALLARAFYAGKYDPMVNLNNGATQSQFHKLQNVKGNPKQDLAITLCDEWRNSGHNDYQPLLDLRDMIDGQALLLAETADLEAALRAVRRLGSELYDMRIQQLRDEAERVTQPIRTRMEALDKLRERLNDTRKELPEKIGKKHELYAPQLNSALMGIAKQQESSIRETVKEIGEAGAETKAGQFRQGWKKSGASTLAGRLTGGLLTALSSSRLENTFDTLLREDPFFTALGHEAARNQQLFLACQKPEDGREVFAALERVCEKMIASINQTHSEKNDECIKAGRQITIQPLLGEWRHAVTAMVKEEAAGIRRGLSSFCCFLPGDAPGRNRQPAETWGFVSSDSVVSALREAMANSALKADHAAKEIRERYETLGTQVINGGRYSPEVSLKNVQSLVFQQVVCPVLKQAAENAALRFNAAKITALMDRLLEAAREYADKALEPVFSDADKAIGQCRAVLEDALNQWPEPEKDDSLNDLKPFSKGAADNG